MHSTTMHRHPALAALWTKEMFSVSLTPLLLFSITTEPSSFIIWASEPVVLAYVLMPLSRNAAAINRVVVVLPLVPLTRILNGIFFNAMQWRMLSIRDKTRRTIIKTIIRFTSLLSPRQQINPIVSQDPLLIVRNQNYSVSVLPPSYE